MSDSNVQPSSFGSRGLRGAYWRSVGGLAALLAASFGVAAGVAYLLGAPALAKDFFSAHRSVGNAREILVPALAVSAGAGFLLAAGGGALLLWGHTRRLRRPLLELEALVREVAAGRFPAPPPATARRTPATEAAAAFAPLRSQLGEVRRLAKEIQTIILHLHYRSGSSEQLTLKDLRGIAVQLDALVKDLARAAAWFEG